MSYQPLRVERVLRINRLYSLHYFQFAAGYIFPGESHDFWEMVYIDHGKADIGAGSETFHLRQGQAFFHKPGEFHSIWADSASGPNIMVLSFSCSAPVLRALGHRVLFMNAQLSSILRQIIHEGELCFGPLLDISDLHMLVPLSSAPFGSQQLIETYLTQLLILLLRDQQSERKRTDYSPPHLTDEQAAADLTAQLSQYMRSHLDGSLTFPGICRYSGLCSTALKTCFRRYNGIGVMEYYRRLRIEEARRLLREGRLNVTQTAEKLGYSSVYAFSRQFKKLVGTTPIGYLKSVRE